MDNATAEAEVLESENGAAFAGVDGKVSSAGDEMGSQTEAVKVAESGRLRPRAAACANSVRRRGMGLRNRENANCGDPVGTLPVPCGVRVHFAGVWRNLSKIPAKFG